LVNSTFLPGDREFRFERSAFPAGARRSPWPANGPGSAVCVCGGPSGGHDVNALSFWRHLNAVLSGALALLLAARQGSESPRSAWALEHATLAPNAVPTPTGLRLLQGIAYRPDITLENGTIEFELAPPGGVFAGLAFRMANTADYEIIYFISSENGDRWKAIQYQPVFAGETTWQLYNEAPYLASIPKEAGRTLRVRTAIAADRADVCLNDDPIAILRVPDLKRDRARGAIGFWSVAPDGAPGNEIRDLRVDSTRVPALGDPIGAPLRAVPSPRQLMHWRVSERQPAPDGVHAPARLPQELAPDTWRLVTAETTGLMNLTKAIGNPAGRQAANVFGGAGWGLAYAAVTIVSASERSVSLSLSYSDGIGVYLNGRRLYAGDNSADSRYPDYLGVVGHESETIDLPLRAGRNELVLAVTDRAFGWGFRASLDSLDGLTIVP